MSGAIGVVLKGYPRLSETFIARELRALERRGLRLKIFSMRGPREELRQPIVSEIRAPVHYLPEPGAGRGTDLLGANLRALRRRPAAYLGALRHAAARSLARRGLDPLRRLLEGGWLADRLASADPPVRHLHAHFIHAPAELARYAARIGGVGYSVTAHAKDIYTSRPGDLAELIAGARFVLTCTAYNLRHLTSLPGVAPGKVHLAYHGVDLASFAPGPGGFPPGRFVSVGRLVRKKGYDQVLEALALLRADGAEFSWDVYGAGEEEAALRAQARRLGLEDRVRFHGHAAQPEIVARLRQGGLYLCGSVETEDGDRDGIPNALLEAMAMGLPVVATAVSGIPEVVRSGADGLLVPPRDPAALRDAVARLLRDPALASRLGASARARAGEFDAEACLDSCARHFEAVELS